MTSNLIFGQGFGHCEIEGKEPIGLWAGDSKYRGKKGYKINNNVTQILDCRDLIEDASAAGSTVFYPDPPPIFADANKC